MKAWAIKTGRLVLPFSVRATKKQCIRDYITDVMLVKGYSWEYLSKHGYTCVPVKVEEIRKA